MYVPAAFREEDPVALHGAMRRYSFATLVSQTQEGPVATHLPLLLDPEHGELGRLRGHVAKANEHWQHLEAGGETLAVFAGPHAYISPFWNETDPTVPTWNYVAVHAYGRPRLIRERGELRALLHDLTAEFDPERVESWWAGLPETYLERLMGGIVGFEIAITRLEGKWKLAQNRPQADQRGIIAGLERVDDPLSNEVAGLMRDRLRPVER